MTPAVLYVTYDGVLEPLGQSQVVAYLEKLASDHAIWLLSFEKPADVADDARMAAMEARLRACGIQWVPLRYTKRPPVLSTCWDVLRGIVAGRRLIRNQGIRLVHARGYVPSLIALGARLGWRPPAATGRHLPPAATGRYWPPLAVALLFDMRGYWVDEKVEAGHWPAGGWLARVGKWWERRFYAAADAVVSLTHKGVESLPELGVTVRPGVPIEVIPTCADLARFSPAPRDPILAASLGLSNAPVLGCVGTMGNWYLRTPMLDCLSTWARQWPELQLVFVTRDDHATLRRDLLAAGVPDHRMVITEASFADMPRYLRLLDAGLFFIAPSFSKRASAATKLAELLGCGIPVVINDGVGDSGTIVRDGGVGVVLTTLDARAFDAALEALRGLLRDAGAPVRCRRVAEEVFDLSVGVERYRALYRRLLARSG